MIKFLLKMALFVTETDILARIYLKKITIVNHNS